MYQGFRRSFSPQRGQLDVLSALGQLPEESEQAFFQELIVMADEFATYNFFCFDIHNCFSFYLVYLFVKEVNLILKLAPTSLFLLTGEQQPFDWENFVFVRIFHATINFLFHNIPVLDILIVGVGALNRWISPPQRRVLHHWLAPPFRARWWTPIEEILRKDLVVHFQLNWIGPVLEMRIGGFPVH